MFVRSPLRWIGSYPVLSLRFPELATAEQKQVGEKGVSLRFVVDTGASVNTINAKVAADLGLDRVGEVLAGVSVGGNISGGETFMVGDCELDDLSPAERTSFISNLTASALPVATPAAAGILGNGFLDTFAGGVEFTWGSPPSRSDASICFFGDAQGMETKLSGLCNIPVQQLPGTRLPCVMLTVNGVDIPSLLDTGSPITVLNAAAACAAGLGTLDGIGGEGAETNSVSSDANPLTNLFAGALSAFSAACEALSLSQKVASGDVVLIGGANGLVQLERSKTAVSFPIGEVEIGNSTVLVGEMPGLALLDGMGARSEPAAILGVDVLRQRPRLVRRFDEIWL